MRQVGGLGKYQVVTQVLTSMGIHLYLYFTVIRCSFTPLYRVHSRFAMFSVYSTSKRFYHTSFVRHLKSALQVAEDALWKLRPLHGVSRSCPPSVLLTKCKNRGCARCSHPRTYLCYDSKNLHSPECQGIMVALLGDKLLDYRMTYPFLLVVDVALYPPLKKDYF